MRWARDASELVGYQQITVPLATNSEEFESVAESLGAPGVDAKYYRHETGRVSFWRLRAQCRDGRRNHKERVTYRAAPHNARKAYPRRDLTPAQLYRETGDNKTKQH